METNGHCEVSKPWFLKGSVKWETNNANGGRKDAMNGNQQDEGAHQKLLHHMFEHFMANETSNDGSNMQEWEIQKNYIALTEYLEGSAIDDMKKISYYELSQKSTWLARVLKKKLG